MSVIDTQDDYCTTMWSGYGSDCIDVSIHWYVILMHALIDCGYLQILIFHYSAVGQVFQHPKSKLVAAGVEVTFQCQLADHLRPYWVINSFPGVQKNLQELQNRGFNVSQSSQDGITTLSLRVTATIDKNGTVISCSSQEAVSTDIVMLTVIEGKSLTTRAVA